MGEICSIVWFRRDLRLDDNPALCSAAKLGRVIPVFIWCPEEEGQFYPGRVSRWWLKQSLIHFSSSLRNLGIQLILRKSTNTLSLLHELVLATGASYVLFNHLYDPVSLVRDHRVKQGLMQNGIKVQSFNADLLYEPWEVQDDNGRPFTTFQNFWSKCLNMPCEPESPLLPPKVLIGVAGEVATLTPDELGLEEETEIASNALLSRAWSPGWSNADKALDAFLSGPLLEYSRNRKKIDTHTTSFLSPHLHFGELSVRKMFYSLRRFQTLCTADGSTHGEDSVNFFLRSIGFREYSRYLCFNFPFTHERALLPHLKSFPWRVDEGYFKAWRQGRTGYPLVDAGMRELWATGWLHNRLRVIVASFCVKFLMLPWMWGMKYFWDTLLDADLESDILGWQYISGSLPDGHKLDRMDNPETEGYKYDPLGDYVRRWLPELARLPKEWIHHPWDAPPAILRAAGIELGVNYPRPIVEVAAARERLHQAIANIPEHDLPLLDFVSSGYIETSVLNRRVRGLQLLEANSSAPGRSSGTSSTDQMVPSVKRERSCVAASSETETSEKSSIPVNTGTQVSDEHSIVGSSSSANILSAAERKAVLPIRDSDIPHQQQSILNTDTKQRPPNLRLDDNVQQRGSKRKIDSSG